MRFWRGDSVGWWEADTLVIDSINFKIGAAPRGATLGHDEAIVFTGRDMHLIERFSLAAPDVLLYEFTVEDPKMFSRSWTARASMPRTQMRMFEFVPRRELRFQEYSVRGPEERSDDVRAEPRTRSQGHGRGGAREL
jgi:hypothetical protein